MWTIMIWTGYNVVDHLLYRAVYVLYDPGAILETFYYRMHGGRSEDNDTSMSTMRVA